MMEYNSHFDGSWSFSWKTVKFGDKSVSFPDSIPYLLLQDRPLSSRPPVAPPRVFTCCHQWHASWYTGDPIPSSWDASRAPTFKIIHSNVPYQDISSYTKINQDMSRISDSISHSISPTSQKQKNSFASVSTDIILDFGIPAAAAKACQKRHCREDSTSRRFQKRCSRPVIRDDHRHLWH